jgi:hypothetical protein
MNSEKPFAETIEEYKVRKNNVHDFINKKGWSKIVRFEKLYDPYGSADKDPAMDVIFATKDVLDNVYKINERRNKSLIDPVEIVEVPFVLGADEEIISSKRVRKGEINRAGESYVNLFKGKDRYFITKKLRQELKKPMGKLILEDFCKIPDATRYLITVGDIVTIKFRQMERQADLEIVDFKTRRKKLTQKEVKTYLEEGHKYSNPAGTINCHTAIKFYEKLDHFLDKGERQQLVIDGEEDLLVIPAVLLSPIGAVVAYGQYDEGVVFINVTEEKKIEVAEILKNFDYGFKL